MQCETTWCTYSVAAILQDVLPLDDVAKNPLEVDKKPDTNSKEEQAKDEEGVKFSIFFV